MAEPAKKIATYQDVLDAPEHMVAQVINGVLDLQPRPSGAHAGASSGLGADIYNAFHRGRGGPGGWIILDEPELHLGGDILVPDIAGWRRERLPKIPDAAYLTLAPDWVCEVLSPRTALRDRGPKLEIYARHGVSHAWLVDPRLRSLEVYRRDGGSWILVHVYGNSDVVRAEPFDAIELDLAALWADIEESPEK